MPPETRLRIYPQRRAAINRDLGLERLPEKNLHWLAVTIDLCRQERFGSVSRHASLAGRLLYAAIGFHPTNEMVLNL